MALFSSMAEMAADLNQINPPEIAALSGNDNRLVIFTNDSRISTDCNNNGIPDACDIAARRAQDCNLNQISDECDVAYQVGPVLPSCVEAL